MGTESSDVSVNLQQLVRMINKTNCVEFQSEEARVVTEAGVCSQSTWGIIQEMLQSLKPNSEKIQAV